MPSPMQQALLMASAAGGGGGGGDPSWSNVVLLMGFEGTNGSTGAPGMTDESLSAHGTATVLLDATISTTRHKAGNSSLWLTKGGANSASEITFPTSGDWNLGSGPFTIEGFISTISLDGFAQQNVFIGPNGNWAVYFAATSLSFHATNGTTPFTISDTVNTPDAVNWYYFAVDFDGSKYRLYDNFNGPGGTPLASATMRASNASPITISSSATLVQFGTTSATVGLQTFNGYIDEFRITKGVARYATDTSFAVPTVPFPRHA